MKTKKKAFTLMELLVAMIVCMVLLVMLFSLLGKTYKIYQRTTATGGENGYIVVMLSEIEMLTRGCDSVKVDDTNKILTINTNGNDYAVNTTDYGVDATIALDTTAKLISIDIGGEVYCVTYVEKAPS